MLQLFTLCRRPAKNCPIAPLDNPYTICSYEHTSISITPENVQKLLDELEWAKDPKIAYKTINARVETVDTAPSYRSAFKKRRCLIPVDGFYEWKKVLGGKIPYSIQMKDDSSFVFAGLWEGWKPAESEDWLCTCTIITGEPNDLVRQIHTRMPVILPEEHHQAWLVGLRQNIH
jgi:putative SOS response-associated peptidase YedK